MHLWCRQWNESVTSYLGDEWISEGELCLKILSLHKDLSVEIFIKKFSVVILNNMSAETHFKWKSFSFLTYYISDSPDSRQVVYCNQDNLRVRD